MSRSPIRYLRLSCVLVAASSVSCRPKDPTPDSAASTPNRPPPVVSGAVRLSALTVASGNFDFDDALVQKILDTAGTLRAKDWDDKHDRTDQRRLLDGTCSADATGCIPKTFTRIIPRKGAHLTKEADLGKGRIVGKLVSLETNANIPYRKLALYAGTPEVYWWIGLHKVPGNPGVDTISVYVPSDWSSSKKATWRVVGMVKTDPSNPNFKHSHSSARFVWNDNDDETWVTCVVQGCCQPPAVFDSLHKSGAALDNQ